jgi:hypothetical protein
MKDDPKEKVAMLSLLESYNIIYSLGVRRHYTDSDIEYALRINHAGRSIVEYSDSGDGRLPPLHYGLLSWKERIRILITSTHHSQIEEKLKTITNATGLHYLVCEVRPALIGRSVALCAQSSNENENEASEVDSSVSIVDSR